MNTIGALAIHQPGAYFVWALLSLLDDEELLVIDPELGLGWEVRINGVADNFQFHLLLADALFGGGYLEGEPPEPHVMEVVSGRGPAMLDEHVIGFWNLFNWTGLSPDGTLPDGYFNQGSQHWIPNEGVPADIRSLDGRRIVLLAPTPVIRQWRPARLFEPLSATLTVERTLEQGEVDRWTKRIIEERTAGQDAEAATPGQASS